MDTLEILSKAQELGGDARREAMMQAFITARDLGCKITPGGGKVGGGGGEGGGGGRRGVLVVLLG